MANIKEKNAQLNDELLNKSRQIAALENSRKDLDKSEEELKKTIEDLQKKLDAQFEQKRPPMERKKSVKFNLEPETVIDQSDSNAEKIAELEKALEDAAKEREEILEAAQNEIEYHR